MEIKGDNIYVNIKELPGLEQISSEDYLVVETETGTNILKYKNLVIQPENTTFYNEISENTTNITTLSTTLSAESGTFIPTIYNQSTPGVVTYGSDRWGYWTRHHRTIFFNLRVIWTNKTGTGALILDGLPFNITVPYAVYIGYTGGCFEKPVGAILDHQYPVIKMFFYDTTTGLPLSGKSSGFLDIAGHYNI